jgi:arylsulfatase A-like enzyme
MPTFSALAGYPLRLERGGRDIWPTITDSVSGRQRTFYWQHGSKIAIRHGDWKLVANRDFTRSELFNLAEDPNETENLAGQLPQKVAELKSLVAPP